MKKAIVNHEGTKNMKVKDPACASLFRLRALRVFVVHFVIVATVLFKRLQARLQLGSMSASHAVG